MDHPVKRWWPLTPATRLRLIGTVVLVLGVAAALYWRWTRGTVQAVDDLLPGFSQQRARQNEILMGGMVAAALQWVDALRDPRVQSLIVAGVSVLAAIVCFRVASLLD